MAKSTSNPSLIDLPAELLTAIVKESYCGVTLLVKKPSAMDDARTMTIHSEPKNTIMSVNKQFRAIGDKIGKDVLLHNATLSCRELCPEDFEAGSQIPSSGFRNVRQLSLDVKQVHALIGRWEMEGCEPKFKLNWSFLAINLRHLMKVTVTMKEHVEYSDPIPSPTEMLSKLNERMTHYDSLRELLRVRPDPFRRKAPGHALVGQPAPFELLFTMKITHIIPKSYLGVLVSGLVFTPAVEPHANELVKACQASFSNNALVILDCCVAEEADWREAFLQVYDVGSEEDRTRARWQQ